MSKEIFIKTYSEKVEKNYDSLEPYFNHSLILLSAINPVKYEIINCLMIEQYISAINCTNHFLERLMKLALIQNETDGLKYDQIDELTNKLDIAYEKYDSLNLWESIDKCYREKQLISNHEFILLNSMKDKIRNSYSHAEMKKINNGAPRKIPMMMYSFKDINQSVKNRTQLNHKKVLVPTNSPTFQSEIQKKNSKNLAITYFKIVYQIAKNIDVKLDVNNEYYK